MRVNIGSLKGKRGESIQVDFRVEQLPKPGWGADVKQIAPVDVQVTITNTGRCYLVRGLVHAVVELQCGRCLKGFPYELEAPLEEEFYQLSEAHRPAAALEEQQFAEESTFSGDTIDLAEAVREQAVLALPYQALCRADCAGLCTVCGKDLNEGDCGCHRDTTDPRLADLARLLGGSQKSSDNPEQ